MQEVRQRQADQLREAALDEGVAAGTVDDPERLVEPDRDVGLDAPDQSLGRPRVVQRLGDREEVAEVFPELAVRDSDGRVETVHYETLNVLLVNEVQKQQQRIEALEQKVNDLLTRSTH